MATATVARKRPATKRSPKPAAERRDVYQDITDRIIGLLEAGTVPWHKPWNAATGLPTSVATNKPYRGLNILILASVAQANGYSSKYWITMPEMTKRGATLKGERGGEGRKGTQIIYWSFFDAKDKETGEVKRIPLLKFFYVWNTDQVEGDLKLPKQPEVVEHAHDRIAECDAIIAGYSQRESLSVRHGGDRAYYTPDADYVQLPELKFFDSAEEYYGAAFHELGHSTGHASRLARPGIADLPAGHRFGDELYSKEELVAELCSAFLSAETGIVAATVDNTAAYLQNWVNALKGDKKLIVSASSAAQKAATLILGTQPAEKTDEVAETS